MCKSELIDCVQCYLPLIINTAGRLFENLSNPNMHSLSEASTLQLTEQNFVLSSSHLPQYDRLAATRDRDLLGLVSLDPLRSNCKSRCIHVQVPETYGSMCLRIKVGNFMNNSNKYSTLTINLELLKNMSVEQR